VDEVDDEDEEFGHVMEVSASVDIAKIFCTWLHLIASH
jgi:hypothetical protein